MSTIKDIVQRYEVTTDTPEQYGGASPTWEEFAAERVDGDSERPSEEPEMSELLDGRSSQAGVSVEAQYVIYELTTQSTVYETFRDAANNVTPVWIRETPDQDDANPEIIGGEGGMLCGVGKTRQGFGGHRAFTVMLNSTAANAGGVIEDEQTGS